MLQLRKVAASAWHQLKDSHLFQQQLQRSVRGRISLLVTVHASRLLQAASLLGQLTVVSVHIPHQLSVVSSQCLLDICDVQEASCQQKSVMPDRLGASTWSLHVLQRQRPACLATRIYRKNYAKIQMGRLCKNSLSGSKKLAENGFVKGNKIVHHAAAASAMFLARVATRLSRSTFPNFLPGLWQTYMTPTCFAALQHPAIFWLKQYEQIGICHSPPLTIEISKQQKLVNSPKMSHVQSDNLWEKLFRRAIFCRPHRHGLNGSQRGFLRISSHHNTCTCVMAILTKVTIPIPIAILNRF